MKRVLLIGGLGFIGYNTAHVLRGRGYKVKIYDNASTNVVTMAGALRNLGDVDIVENPSNLVETRTLWSQVYSVDTVVMLASRYPSGGSGLTQFELSQNVINTAVVAQACAEAGRRLVFISSAAVYRDMRDNEDEADENFDLGISQYGMSKQACEAAVKSIMGDGSYWILRLSNVYGPYGHGFINTAVEKVVNGDPVPITGGGAQVRDFVHVHDVAKAIQMACEHSKPRVKALNISSGYGMSVNRILSDIKDAFRYDEWDIIYSGMDPGCHRSILSNAKASQLLGWGTKVKWSPEIIMAISKGAVP